MSFTHLRQLLARRASPPGAAQLQLHRPHPPPRPGQHGFAARFIQDMAAAATVAAGQNRPTANCRRRTMTAPRVGALLAFAAAPAAWRPDPPFPPGRSKYLPLQPGWIKDPPLPLGHVAGPVYQAPAGIPVHAVTGGMPGWQITLIAIGAALVAATMAVLLDRAWAARHKPVTQAASAGHALAGCADAGPASSIATSPREHRHARPMPGLRRG